MTGRKHECTIGDQYPHGFIEGPFLGAGEEHIRNSIETFHALRENTTRLWMRRAWPSTVIVRPKGDEGEKQRKPKDCNRIRNRVSAVVHLRRKKV